MTCCHWQRATKLATQALKYKARRGVTPQPRAGIPFGMSRPSRGDDAEPTA